jgi:O-antigen/teichoic acid export membrane protein
MVHAVAEVALAVVLLATAAALHPWLRLRLDWPHWSALRSRAGFGLVSQLNVLLVRTIYQPGVLILGALLGPAATVPLSLGQKFPQAASLLADRAGAVFLPAASAHERSDDEVRADVLAKGTRWVTALALPVWIVLMILGPAILSAWLRSFPKGTLVVLWLSASALLADGIASCATHFVWGQQIVRRLTRVLLMTASLNLALTVILAPRWGAVGVAAALLVSLTGGSLLTIYVAAKSCGTTIGRVLAPIRALLLPSGACAAVAAGAVTVGIRGWPAVLISAALAGAMYVTVILRLSSCAAEAALVRNFWRAIRKPAHESLMS